MRHEQCSAGITARALRWAFRDELLGNPALVRLMANAAGVYRMSEIGEITYRPTDGVLVTCVSGSGEAVTIVLRIEIDKNGGTSAFLPTGEAPVVARQKSGGRRVVTIAPKAWFTLRDNVYGATNMTPLETFQNMGSEAFQDAIDQALYRAFKSYQELRRPKTELPGWVKRRLFVSRRF